MKSYKRLFNLEIKRNRKQIINLILIVLLFAVIINVIVFLFENEKIKLNTTIGLVVEDNAFEVNLLLGSIRNEELKEIITFINIDLEEGKELLKNNEIVSLIHINKDTFNDLNSGSSAKLNMYVNNTNDLRVKFLSNYIENMVDMLNSSQNSSMIYYEMLKSNGEVYEKRISELNRLSLKYITLFLSRSKVFKEDKIINKYLGLTSFNYYYTVLLVLSIVLSSIIYFNTLSNDMKDGKISRLINSGYSIRSIFVSKVVISVLYLSILLVPLRIALFVVLCNYSISNLMIFIISFIFISVFIQLFIIYFYIHISNDIVRDISFVIFFGLLSVFAGFIVPIDSLPNFINNIKEINILYIPFKMLIGRNLNFINITSLLFYIVLLCELIRKEMSFEKLFINKFEK
jgi:hypothetical protein